ncbi:MAG: DUF488 domain-containing protein [Synergistaceae bacterium]|nr:DUF488 domain-containing protein [Synergistaceae bacterium]
MNSPLVLTIGHSNRTLEEFIELLQLNEVELVADVRTVPRSRYNPQFNRDALPESLRKVGIEYTHIAGLGGFRHTVTDSVNMGWRNASFRGFADYMQTKEFEENLTLLIDLARTKRVALMCAEAVPWRCHRSLISDALLIRGIRVEDILGKGERREHVLTSWAEVQGTIITYPPSL